ncbi:O-antigen ligase family protein [Acinetobacter rathckeae]|uniref:O-antigen ligase family protein n=1 Tax=Acinetobacter rathckeae TaxID=2605272 RepID=UPI0018A2682D|nr:O-antigen ligase family protein [Acinetobacter rathckeae]MBF7688387.1 O-antigen ligase C-terminal domain-containing protein [Acinetobacter rathckeae]MBF7695472.1 O-antigen ligase C-terminal domain-containing protein [Acinetobacter rathckeae]
MPRFLFLLAAFLLGLAWLSPDHYTPWLTFSSEMLTYASVFCLLAVYIERPLQCPKLQLLWLLVVSIPLLQWCFGIELYFSKAFLSACYLLGFAVTAVLGFNLAKDYGKACILKYLSILMCCVAVVSCCVALLQWLDLEKSMWGMMQLRGNRPYANFAQPNNFATFLLMSLFGAWYLFEKRILPQLIIAMIAGLIIFTIALTQSRTPWIACIVLTAYILYKYKHDDYRLTHKHLVLWLLVYINSLLWLPVLNGWLVQLGWSQAQMVDVVQRANSSHSRFGIWAQMLYAIREQPWFGYGWNQTSIAQLVGADFIVHSERTNSAHNVVLELLVWNGIPLGTAIIGYFSYWLFKLNQVVRCKENLIASLMVLSVMIHAMLEFPQNYAYFLFPSAFLLGFIQADVVGQKVFLLKSWFNTSFLVLCILLYGLVWRDYIVAVDELSLARKHAENGVDKTASSQIILLTEYKARCSWYALNRFGSLSPEQVQQFHRAVLVSPTEYDLYKYAQLLAFNHQQQQAEHQLQLIKGLYRVNYAVDQLAKRP